MLLRPEHEKDVLDVQPDEPGWLLWVRRVIFYSIVWGGMLAFVLLGRWVWSIAFWD